MRIAVIGGGVYLTPLVRAVASRWRGQPLHWAVAARRWDRLQVIAAGTRTWLARHRPDWAIEAAPTVRAAVSGADAVIVLLRVGGLEARGRDEALAWSVGAVGDEGLGIGGLANACRTLPVLRELGRVLRAEAPRAPVLNLVAPLGLSTRALRAEGVDAWGICELPAVTRAAWEAACGAARLHYLGLNHLGWFWGADAHARAVLDACAGAGLVDAVVLERYGAAPLPYHGDVVDPESGRRLGRERRPGRASELVRLADEAVHVLQAGGAAEDAIERRATPWFDEALAPVLVAVLGGQPWSGYANLPAEHALPGLGADTMLETAVTCEAGASGVEVRRMVPEPPPQVRDFLLRFGQFEEAAWTAAGSLASADLSLALERLPMAFDRSRTAEIIAAIQGDPHRSSTPRQMPF